MDAYLFIAEGLKPVGLLGQMSASEKYDAVRNLPGSSVGSPWVWGGALVLLAAVSIVIAAMIVARRLARRKHAWGAFRHSASRLGLSGDEQDVLADLASRAGIKEPHSVLTIESAFERAAGGLTGKRRPALSADARGKAGRIVESLRTKLGFGRSPAPRNHASVSTRQIPESASLELSFGGGGRSVGGVVLTNLPDALAVLMHTPTKCAIGDRLTVRYSNMGAVWEFDAQIAEVIDATILVRHTDVIRFVNRRRFPRIPTKHAAYIAGFQFLVESGRISAPQFVRGTLSEIAGAGLELQAPLEIEVGERALVVVQIGGEQVVQGLCRVRRVETADRQGMNNIMVEMVELGAQEVALLSRQTNAAAQQRATEARPRQQPRAAEAPA